ncbi:hypothetical protein Mal35_16980 [Gimesia maris]|uniref:hypothetical protein n=1 Tax=Gimesia maris TaxID=122 RepID=UPI00118D505A|nr:hypothetical protein [Gimesia maris]QDT78266.1 hypothetical protein Mal35_16980 [Gimesia maris]
MQEVYKKQSPQPGADRSTFPLLPVEELLSLQPVANDKVAKAAAEVSKPMLASCPVNRLTSLHNRALMKLESDSEPMTTVPSSGEKSDADAYDEYFSVVRAKGNDRHIFALGTLTAFRDLFEDIESGTDLDAIEINNIREAEYELLRLIALDEDLYY